MTGPACSTPVIVFYSLLEYHATGVKPGTPNCNIMQSLGPCRVGLVVSVSASQTVSREFASQPGHTKDHHKSGTNCLPARHAMH